MSERDVPHAPGHEPASTVSRIAWAVMRSAFETREARQRSAYAGVEGVPLLGQGSYGRVILARETLSLGCSTSSSPLLAIKVLPLLDPDEDSDETPSLVLAHEGERRCADEEIEVEEEESDSPPARCPPRRGRSRSRSRSLETDSGSTRASPSPIPQKPSTLLHKTEMRIDARVAAEISALVAIHHPRVVSLLDVEFSRRHAYLVFPAMRRSLGDFLRARRAPLGDSALRRFARQLLEAVEATHAAGVMHRDVKPDNLLVNEYGDELVLCDFGAACVGKAESAEDEKTTVWYRAPEACLGMGIVPYTNAVDCWAAGCVVFEMCTREALFRASPVCEYDVVAKTFRLLGTPSLAHDVWPAGTGYPAFFPGGPQFPPGGRLGSFETIPASLRGVVRALVAYPDTRASASRALRILDAAPLLSSGTTLFGEDL